MFASDAVAGVDGGQEGTQLGVVGLPRDAQRRLDRWIGKEMSVSGFLQYERWNIPVLAATPQTDWTSSVQLTFWPRSRQ